MSGADHIHTNEGERPEATDEIRQNVEAKIAERLNRNGQDTSTLDVTEAATLADHSEDDADAPGQSAG